MGSSARMGIWFAGTGSNTWVMEILKDPKEIRDPDKLAPQCRAIGNPGLARFAWASLFYREALASAFAFSQVSLLEGSII